MAGGSRGKSRFALESLARAKNAAAARYPLTLGPLGAAETLSPSPRCSGDGPFEAFAAPCPSAGPPWPRGFNPLQLIAAKDGYQPIAKLVRIIKGSSVTVNFTLTRS